MGFERHARQVSCLVGSIHRLVVDIQSGEVAFGLPSSCDGVVREVGNRCP